jgi:predicted glycosyltransferase
MDHNFKNLHSPSGQLLEAVKVQRRRKLKALFLAERPDIFLVELYPIGRRAFRFELDPLLSAIAGGGLPRCKVVCSVRDILVDKEKRARHEAWAVDILNRQFDMLVVHADPSIVRFEETFGQMEAIRIPIVYSGFVTDRRRPVADARAWRRLHGIADHQRLVLVSAGGGAVGFEIVKAAAQAVAFLQARLPTALQGFTGPFMPASQVNELKRLESQTICFQRFSTHFTTWLQAADISISMAGYNTCMNILTTGATALVYPFAQNREQGLRAQRLAARNALTILSARDLEPDRLARCLEEAFGRAPSSTTIDLDGALRTAELLERLIDQGENR